MCGRFVSTAPASVVARHFDVGVVRAADLPPRWNVAPTDEVYAVATSAGRRLLGTFSWGLVPCWSPPGPPRRRLINVRAESTSTKPAFRRALQRRRCIIPADGFYEWKPAGAQAPKRPYFLRGRDGSPLAFAGLWDVWRDGGEGPPLRSCSILTTEPNALVAQVHDRMPVVLPAEVWDLWLDEGQTDRAALGSLLRPFPAELMEMWPVGTGVNRVQNDGPALTARLREGEPSP